MSVAITTAWRRSVESWRRAAYFGFWGAGGGLVGALLCEILGLGGQRATFIELMIKVGVWFGVIGALIATAILLGHLVYGSRALSAAVVGSNLLRLALGAVFGAVSGFIAGAFAQGLYTGIGPTEVLRAICWGVAGGLLGIALSFRISNLTVLRGFGGGFVGGVAGGIVFIGISVSGSQAVGRLLGIAIIGFAIGLMIMLADALFRKAWIEVRYGPRETRTLTLGREPLRVGSDAARCTIYVKDVPAMACAYRFEQGRVICEDKINNRSGPVPFGVPMVIGRVTVTPFGGESQDLAGFPSGAPMPSPAVTVGDHWILSLKDGREFALREGVRLAVTDVRGLEASERTGSVAEVLRNPENPGMVGLKNLSRQRWSATFSSGRQVEIEPGRSLRLETGAQINFGPTQGCIRSGNLGSASSAGGPTASRQVRPGVSFEDRS